MWRLRQILNAILDHWIMSIVLVVVIAATVLGAVFIGGWIIAALLSIFIVGLAIWFGSMGTLAGSIIIGMLLKLFEATIQSFISIWWTTPACGRFFDLVRTTGYVELVATIFLVAYATRFAVSALVGPIKLVSTNTTNKINLTDLEQE